MSLADWTVPAAIIATIGVIAVLVRIGMWIGRVNSDRDSFKEFMEAVRDDFKEVRADIKNILVKVSGPQTVERGRPLRLTELGKEIADEIGAYSIAHELSERVQREIEGMTAHDIQEFCMTYVNDEWVLEPHHERSIKDAAFNHGVIMKQVLEVIAIELRDIPLAPSTRKTVE